MSAPHLALLLTIASVLGCLLWLRIWEALAGRPEYNDPAPRIVVYLFVYAALILFVAGFN